MNPEEYTLFKKIQADIKIFIYALCHVFVYVVIITPLSKSDRCFSHRDVVYLSEVCHFRAQAQNGDWSQTEPDTSPSSIESEWTGTAAVGWIFHREYPGVTSSPCCRD